MASKVEAEKAKLAAEARKFGAEAHKLAAEAKTARALAVQQEIILARERHKRERELAGDEYHHVYRFEGPVGASSVKTCMEQLAVWNRTEPGCPLEIVFHSPGGDVITGMALFDYIQQLRRGGHYVTTASLGYSASMAGILLQAGQHRVMSKESWLLIHEASFGASGSYGEVADTVKWVERIQERILDIFAERSNLTKTSIRRRWHRTDWWLSSDESLKYGFVDEIL